MEWLWFCDLNCPDRACAVKQCLRLNQIMAVRESPEYLAIQQNVKVLKEAVIRGEVPAALFQNNLITRDVYRAAINENLGQEKRGGDIMMEVLDAVHLNRAMFDKFCEALDEETIMKELVVNLRGILIYWVCQGACQLGNSFSLIQLHWKSSPTSLVYIIHCT